MEAYYQQAARVAGATVQTSLSNTLTNTTVCTKIASNATAYGIMKSHYSTTMTSYIDNASYWNEGLNYLNYKCTLKCYLLHNGNLCSLITGGWGSSNKGYVTSGSSVGINSGSSSASRVYTINAITGSFSKLSFYVSSASGEFKYGLASTKDTDNWKEHSYTYNGTIPGWFNVSWFSGYYPQMQIAADRSSNRVTITNAYIIP